MLFNIRQNAQNKRLCASQASAPNITRIYFKRVVEKMQLFKSSPVKAPRVFFADAPHLYSILMPFYEEEVIHQPNIGPKLLNTGLCFRNVYPDLNAAITINARQQHWEMFAGLDQHTPEPDITVYAAADLAHMFWLGRLNILKAMRHGQLKYQGPLLSILHLLPALFPAMRQYPHYLKRAGHHDLLDF